jgi:5-methylcytosine-specific restriction endonuclease McrA
MKITSREYEAKWARENPGRAAVYCAKWRAKHPERGVEASAKWYDKNREQHAAMTAKWRKENPEAVRRKSRKRRALKHDAFYVEHETPMPADGRCPHCRILMIGEHPAPSSPSQDHIIPLTRGGHHVPENTMMICLECNLIKGNRLLPSLLNKITQRKSPVISDRA